MANTQKKLELLKEIYRNAGERPVNNSDALSCLKERFGDVDEHNDLRNNQQRLKAMGYIRKGPERGQWIYNDSSSNSDNNKTKNDPGNGLKVLSVSQFIKDHSKNLKIPDLQRSYVWKREQWEQLWDDLIRVYKRKTDESYLDADPCPQHFLGAVILKKEAKENENEAPYIVLDGQQRLTTIMILIHYFLLDIEKDDQNNQDYMEQKEFVNNCFINSANISIEDDTTDDKNEKVAAYLGAARFFAECHAEMNYKNPKELLDTLLHRFFLMEKVTEDNENDVFEGLNATGVNLKLADLILNYILEKKASNTALPGSLEEEKKKWTGYFEKIYKGKQLLFEEEEEPSDEEVEQEKPLKLKKYLNALYSINRVNKSVVPETVDGFLAAVNMANAFENEIDNSNKTDLSGLEKIERTMKTWHRLYIAVTDPVSLDEKDKLLGKPFVNELYYMSLVTSAIYTPMLMRLLFLNEKEKLSDNDVLAALYAMIVFQLYKTVYAPRANSDLFGVQNKAVILDHILCSLKENKDFSPSQAARLLLGKEVFESARNAFKADSELKVYPSEDVNSILNFMYLPSVSKLMLCIDYDKQDKESGEKGTIYGIERGENMSFQVEHLIAQNLYEDNNGVPITIETYGFDPGSIGKVPNLVLLEGSLNNRIKAKCPEDKYNDGWKESKLCTYYQADYEYFKKGANKRAEYINCEKERALTLCKRVASFCCTILSGNEKPPKNKSHYILLEKRALGNTTAVIPLTGEKIDEISPSMENVYYLLDGDFLSTDPPRINEENNWKAYYYGDSAESIQSEVRKSSKDTLLPFINKFVEKWEEKSRDNKQSAPGDWLKDREKANIERLDNDHDPEAILQNPYNMKTIHTVCLENVLSNLKNKKTLESKNKEYISRIIKKSKYYNDDEKTEIRVCTDFSGKALALNLAVIYREITKSNRSVKFGFWLQTQNYNLQIVNGKLMLLNYINVGDQEIFADWIMKQNAEKSGTEPKDFINHNNIHELSDQGVKSYFTAKGERFTDLLKIGMDIPLYQRKYVWDRNNWEALWTELESADNALCLGTIILNEDNGHCSIVDGQQRLSTLCILYSVLNRDQQENPLLIRQLLPENRDRQKDRCIEFYESRLNELAGSSDEKEALVKNLSEKVNRVYFDAIRINAQGTLKDLYQYAVFASVNGKGIKLTLEEKIKNVLFKQYSILNKNDSDSIAQRIQDIVAMPGFISAYVESNLCEHVSENDLYERFKDIQIRNSENLSESDLKKDLDQLYYQCRMFAAIKGIKLWSAKKREKTGENELSEILKENNININNDLYMWVLFYRELSVTTADSLLLHNFTHSPNVESLTELVRHIVLLYFLLYVMDRSGNDKKSVNAKFPRAILLENANELKATFKVKKKDRNDCEETVTIVSEAFLKDPQENAENIWRNYILSLPLGSMMKRSIPRFILLMIERWIGLDQDTLIKILEDADNYEIEHICPASNDNYISINGYRPPQINMFSNICLLEKTINVKCSNWLMADERANKGGKIYAKGKNDGQDSVDSERHYKESKLVMPNMFYGKNCYNYMENLKSSKNKNGKNVWVYSAETAKRRMEDLKKLLFPETDSIFIKDLKAILP